MYLRYKKNSCFQLLIDGNITIDKQEVAEALNNFFVDVGMNAVRNIRDWQSFLISCPLLSTKTTIPLATTFRQKTLNEIIRILGSMADGMKGCDELPAKFSKDNFTSLGNIILDICNCSLSNVIFPDALMIAMVICL